MVFVVSEAFFLKIRMGLFFGHRLLLIEINPNFLYLEKSPAKILEAAKKNLIKSNLKKSRLFCFPPHTLA